MSGPFRVPGLDVPVRTGQGSRPAPLARQVLMDPAFAPSPGTLGVALPLASLYRDTGLV